MKIVFDRHALLEQGMVAGASLVALALLLVFYSVVSGAVSRAAERQARAQDAPVAALRSKPMATLEASARARDLTVYTPRTVSYRAPR